MLCSDLFIPLQVSGMLITHKPCTNGSVFDVIPNMTTICATCLFSLKNTGKVKSVEKSAKIVRISWIHSEWQRERNTAAGLKEIKRKMGILYKQTQ